MQTSSGRQGDFGPQPVAPHRAQDAGDALVTDQGLPDGAIDEESQARSSTDSIDLTSLINRNVTLTGSFDLRGVEAKSVSKLLDSLPMPALLVDDGYAVAFANDYWTETIGDFNKIEGRAFNRLFPDPSQAAQVQDLLHATFTDRKPRARKLSLNTGKKQIWGRMHLRSLRFGVRRYILVLYQDLTSEKEQLNLVKRHSEELRRAHGQLERRVEQRTEELKRANAQLLAEIAERKRTERALRDSEANYQSIFDAANDAIFVQDVESFQILDANEKMCEIFGYTPDEVRNLTLSHLCADEATSSFTDTSQWLKKAAEGHPQLFEWLSRDKHGRLFWVEVNLKRAVICGHDRLLAIVRDITERKRLEQQLRQAQKMEAVGRLAGGVAHDFNNALTAVLGYSNMLLQQMPVDTVQRKKVEKIIEAAQRATDLTRELLAFGRKQVLDVQMLDLNAVLSDMSEVVRRLVGESIEPIIVLDPSAPRVKADRSQIERIVVNLVLNARDAMSKGGELIIETSAVSVDDTSAGMFGEMEVGKYVMVAVSDTGAGMSAETLARIFEPFFSTKRRGKRTGLGLAMVYGIMKQHRGHVTVHSEPGMGTTFKLYWPAVMETNETLQEEFDTVGDYRGNETILLVEDEDLVRDLAREMLEMLGYRVLEAAAPDDAVRLSQQHQGPINLLVTDVVMPKINGSALYARISPSRPDMRVLYVSGYTENAIVHRGVLAPGVHFLQKPFSADAMARKIRHVLDAR